MKQFDVPVLVGSFDALPTPGDNAGGVYRVDGTLYYERSDGTQVPLDSVGPPNGRTIDDDSTSDDLVLRADDDVVFVTSAVRLTVTIAAYADVPYVTNKPISVLNVGSSSITIATLTVGTLKGNGVDSTGSVDVLTVPVGGAVSLVPRATDSWRAVGGRNTTLSSSVSTVFIGTLTADEPVAAADGLRKVIVASSLDPGSAFDAVTGEFTVDEDRWYEVSFVLTIGDGGPAFTYAVGSLWPATNSVAWDSYPAISHTTRYVEWVLLSAGDTIYPTFLASGRDTTILAGAKFVVKKV